MTHWHKSLLACAALLILGGTALGQGTASRFETLTLTLQVFPRTFLPLEPIPINLRLENTTRQEVEGHAVMDFSSGRVHMVIQPEGSSAYEVRQLSAASAFVVFSRATIIKPAETHDINELIDFNLRRMFPRPGRYAIQAVLTGVDPRETISSNVVSVDVREPTGVEQAAWAYIERTGAADYFFSGLMNDDLPVQLEEIARNFGDTVYGDYANLTLGKHLASQDDDRALVYLSAVATKRDFPLADRAAVALEALRLRRSAR